PSTSLKNLSNIATAKPVTSNRLFHILGSQVYSHIKMLEQLQFVEHENLGRLKVYRTTPKFQSYFGITDLNAMKSKLVATSNKRPSPPSPRAPATTPTSAATAAASTTQPPEKS